MWSPREWTPVHGVAVLWAFYLGPLVVVWAFRPDWASNYAAALLPVLVATGWLLPFWAGLLVLAGASALFAVTGTELVDINLRLGDAQLGRGVATFVFGLIFLGLGRVGGRLLDSSRQAKARAAEAEEARRQTQQLALVFRAAAHEIANPLTPLRFDVVNLRHGAAAGVEPKKLADGLERVERNVDRLERLARDLQDAARGLQGDLPMDAKKMDLAPALRDVALGQAALAHAKGLTWSQEIPSNLVCVADAGRAMQAVANLCQNAIRYTPQGGIVLAARVEGDVPVIEVRDTGLGFASDQAALLFEPFSRAHPDHAEGVGLGLWIVRGIARAHGGDVSLVSAGPGKGAVATLRLGGVPVQAVASAAVSGATATFA